MPDIYCLLDKQGRVVAVIKGYPSAKLNEVTQDCGITLEVVDKIAPMDLKDRQMVEQSINIMFHKVWTKAVGSPDYVKDDWKILVALLTACSIAV